MSHTLHKEGKFTYVEEGEGEVLLLLHGLFGALSNFQGIIDYFKKTHKVVVPILPIFELPVREVSVKALMDHVHEFVLLKDLKPLHVLGNSLGGHVALLYVLEHPERVKSITLAGSSGLFESAMGSTFPKRGDYEFIKKRTEFTFFDPNMATKELVDEVFDIVNDRMKAVQVIATAKSAIRHNLGDNLHNIKVPTLLIWGKQDSITPPFVGEEFHELIPHSEFILMDECGHVPMMEKTEDFNKALEAFLAKI
jgi:pimeloyl-ACP methyl ester carboxylesterase